MNDTSNIRRVWEKFHKQRVAPLFERFPGFYRAVVVETNDPLQWHRVRFKCPELHDSNLKPEECPWADKSPALGGKNAGSWTHPIIGDIVWITFEKNHPYGPIWTGFATPTRRKFYPLESIFTESPLSVNEDGDPDDKPNDFEKNYLPKDRRPMACGWRDRYGSSEVNSSVGYFPIEHKDKPAPLGTDAVAKTALEPGQKPEINKPDRKYLARLSKYGTFQIQSDVGYFWKKEDDSDVGEFLGDFDKDRDFEIDRYKYNLKLFNENKPNSEDQDQRRYEVRTRAGHKLEMRDVGWAQMDGGMSGCEKIPKTKSRKDEYGPPRILSKWEKTDERWVKIRTKGGHLIQAIDIGFHPEEDDLYKILLKDEVGADPDGEKAAGWVGRDARQLRLVSRWGTKFVLDDRGTDPRHADTKEKPRGLGWLIKTRRSWTTEPSTPRGFGFEACDRDELNTARFYSPKSKIIELNDRKDYALMSTDTNDDIAEEWQYLDENEFAKKIGMSVDPEKRAYHVKLDKANGYLRLKTAAGSDNGVKPEPEPFPAAQVGLNQGVEARDGRVGADGAWCEVVDIDHRGMWFSRTHKLGIWRAKEGSDQFILIDDGNKRIVIRNNVDGPLQIYSQGDIEIVSEQNIALKAGGRITFKSDVSVNMESGGSGHAQLTPDAFNTDVINYAQDFVKEPKPCDVLTPDPRVQDKREPVDRAEVGNGPFSPVPESVIRVCP